MERITKKHVGLRVRIWKLSLPGLASGPPISGTIAGVRENGYFDFSEDDGGLFPFLTRSYWRVVEVLPPG